MPKAAVDIDAVISEFQSQQGPKCGFATMDKDARAFADVLLAEPRVQHTTIVKALNARFGTNIRVFAVQRHRRGDCRCRK
jgi:hypothetical protein